MPTLLEVQHAVRRRLLDDADPAATAMLAGILAPDDRLSIYRNTSRATLTNALRLTYPAVQRLVGEEFFAAAADVFITNEPPHSAWLDLYGEGFAEFLQSFRPAAGLPYLPDVARLERAVSRALHAPDAGLLAPSQLAGIAPCDHGRVCFNPHSSLSVMSSNYPVDAIWRAVLAHDDAAIAAIDLAEGGVRLMVERRAGEIEVSRLAEPQWRFAQTLFAGQPLGVALEAADNPDAPTWLAGYLAAGHFSGFSLADGQQQPPILENEP
ncbi:MAG TPA: DNA-binding domain-containing protein [Xanthobacteraceae bacterium]|jgi:hypothetical protein